MHSDIAVKRKKILVIAPVDLKKINTISRLVSTLKNDYDVYTAGYGPSSVTDVPFIPVTRSVENEMSFVDKIWRHLRYRFYKITKNYEGLYWIDWRIVNNNELQQYKFDLIIVQNINFLPVAFRIANGHSKVMFDPQELYFAQYDGNEDWVRDHQPRIAYLCKKYIPKCDLVSFYADEVAELYQSFCPVKKYFIVTSAALYHDLKPLPVNPENIRIIHHGIADPNRGLQLAIEMMEHVEKRFHFYFMLVASSPDYLSFLKDKARNNSNIHFCDPVTPDKIVTSINPYDIGHFSIPPIHANFKFTCPNKYWEFIQARLCVAVGPYVILKRITEKYNTGIIFNDFEIETQARQLNSLTAGDIENYKNQSHLHAYELSAEPQSKKILEAVNELMA